ncbi:MAG TPA: hypothetical protein VHW95_10575 [Steroidobacteraceae bacterium]|jgi:hypothetical protein|nr:hypothetical protein [Steroidobacteraceae bacterium]
MVTRQRSSKSRRLRSRQFTSPDAAQNSEHVYGVPVPEGLHEAIEAERDNLCKVESLLGCMVVSLEYKDDPLDGPYFPAVAQLARELVARSIDGLDPGVLRERLLRNKIEEVFCASLLMQASVFASGELDAEVYRDAA